jgi:hypothetical protein
MVDLTIRFFSGLSPIGKDGGASSLWLVVDRLLGLLAWAAIVCAIGAIRLHLRQTILQEYHQEPPLPALLPGTPPAFRNSP